MTWTTRLLSNVCARAGCTREPCDDHCLCEPHRDEHRARNRRWKRGVAWRREQVVMPW